MGHSLHPPVPCWFRVLQERWAQRGHSRKPAFSSPPLGTGWSKCHRPGTFSSYLGSCCFLLEGAGLCFGVQRGPHFIAWQGQSAGGYTMEVPAHQCLCGRPVITSCKALGELEASPRPCAQPLNPALSFIQRHNRRPDRATLPHADTTALHRAYIPLEPTSTWLQHCCCCWAWYSSPVAAPKPSPWDQAGLPAPSPWPCRFLSRHLGHTQQCTEQLDPLLPHFPPEHYLSCFKHPSIPT